MTSNLDPGLNLQSAAPAQESHVTIPITDRLVQDMPLVGTRYGFLRGRTFTCCNNEINVKLLKMQTLASFIIFSAIWGTVAVGAYASGYSIANISQSTWGIGVTISLPASIALGIFFGRVYQKCLMSSSEV